MDFDLVNIRLKFMFNLRHDYEVAEILNIGSSTYTTNKKRNKIPFEKIINFCNKNNVSLDRVFKPLKQEKGI